LGDDSLSLSPLLRGEGRVLVLRRRMLPPLILTFSP
jgi:hypothetical protein